MMIRLDGGKWRHFNGSSCPLLSFAAAFTGIDRQAGVHIRFRGMHIQNALLKQQKYLTLVQN
ncbi:hypothetical protein QPK31_03335 [Massilia sp. YIM B02769]|uniref:hypothetical protein n=1 Tax=Massilia sp. YIM B02769 TaxID=3050129 RepID=UPI0025B6D6C2|nr:hypothetical protein [Massilia sp. YIM B02769]MDN4057253.1 hypothetical protein [Massilia sp. YIM B02769]